MRAGPAVVLGFGGAAILGFIVALWMRDAFAYREVNGLTEVTVGGKAFAVRDYVGLDNVDVPSRLRGCFVLEDPEGAIAAGDPTSATGDLAPFMAPSGFDCWKPAEMDQDVLAGRATAVSAERLDEGRGAFFERVMIIYPDGRAYHWRRLRQESDF